MTRNKYFSMPTFRFMYTELKYASSNTAVQCTNYLFSGAQVVSPIHVVTLINLAIIV